MRSTCRAAHGADADAAGDRRCRGHRRHLLHPAAAGGGADLPALRRHLPRRLRRRASPRMCRAASASSTAPSCWGCSPMPAPEVIGALLVFRLYYYIVPLFIAGSLFVSFELGQRRAVLQQVTALGSGSDALEVPAIASPGGAGRRAADLPRRAADARARSSRNGPGMSPRSPRISPPRSSARCCWSWPMGCCGG